MALNPSPPPSTPSATPGATPAGGPDPSMEDILASIRRILSEDDGGNAEPPPDETHAAISEPDVLTLDASMMVPEAPAMPEPQPTRIEPTITPPPPPVDPPRAEAPAPEMAPSAAYHPAPAAGADVGPLIAPAAATAAASAMGPLLRRLNVERGTATHRGGPSIEDIVREELRPLLKQWLDAQLPSIVERVVRAEVERVVGNATL
ncbi:MAG: DUF2497 domain-containing protein [Acetobacteraceae bacterium]|nr:DUF2497 domain-containing protein [Acetobacteraceae bacterium]